MSTPQTDIITYEQFLEEMRKVAEQFPVANPLFQKMHKSITGYQWERRSAELLTEERSRHFVEAMSEELFETVCCDGGLKEDARSYLLAVEAAYIRLEIDTTDINFNPPLCARDVTISRADADSAGEFILISGSIG